MSTQPKRVYVCKICGYVYDPSENDKVEFRDLPADWACPVCGVGKDDFEEAYGTPAEG